MLEIDFKYEKLEYMAGINHAASLSQTASRV